MSDEHTKIFTVVYDFPVSHRVEMDIQELWYIQDHLHERLYLIRQLYSLMTNAVYMPQLLAGTEQP